MERQFKICLDGIYIWQGGPLIEGWEKITDPKDLAGYAGDLLSYDIPTVGIKWQGAKIPMSVMAPVLGTIQQFPNMETGYQLYYNPRQKQWCARCPKQLGYSASVFFENDLPMFDGFIFEGTIHTHPNMDAFWSGMDLSSNAKRFGIHMVFGLREGHVKTGKITLFTRIGKYDLEYDDIFEEDVHLFENCEPCQEWVDTISEQFKPEFKLTVDGKTYGPHTRRLDETTSTLSPKELQFMHDSTQIAMREAVFEKRKAKPNNKFQKLLVEKYGYDPMDLSDWLYDAEDDEYVIYNQCEDGDWSNGVMASTDIRSFLDDSDTMFKHDYKPFVTPSEAELAAVLNRKFRGTGWVEAAHSAQKLDAYEEDLLVIFRYLDESELRMMLEDFRDQIDFYNEVCEGVKFGGRLLSSSAFQWADAVLSNAPDVPTATDLDYQLSQCADKDDNLSWHAMALLIVSLETTQMTVIHLWELYQRMKKEGRLEC